ncbi:PhoPQ-activated pathogenicity-related family protein [Pleomorphovibrio marinus]|uniref:PhoPQ-activated pathogenicity-related family protein n=1 Tax=Pleomorphovibrio marinus TaxID=2164132 RepID=UPI000E0A9CEE|nr:PhoPQ-activated protein PqaA family protein [Pleomorphovibrio marinus]
MKKLLNVFIGLNIPFLLILISFGACQPTVKHGQPSENPQPSNPLKEYVSKENRELKYELVHERNENTYDYYVLRVESLNWLSEEIVDKTQWWHWVSVVLPKNSKSDVSIVFIGGGSQNTKLPENPTKEASELAMATGAPTIYIHNIPFQPLNFVGDSLVNRTEDAIIAYGWRKFLEGGAKNEEAEWLARLPMTRAVMTAVDAVAEFSQEHHGATIDKYMVAGASKRGWTTWTTAAMDERVIGMAPIVIDLLDLIPSFKHHWRSYGEWSPAIKDYEREGIMDWMNTEEYDRLLEITDPLNYLEQVKDIPKLLINASGDEFFLPDSWRFYWEKIEGEKHLLYVPNTGHSLKDTDAAQVLAGFFKRLVEEEERPRYSWEITDTHIKIKVDPENGPVQVKLWEATNPDARDFRIYVLGPKWRDTTISLSEDGHYEIPIEAPEKGWKGHFVELTYAGNSPIKVSTGIKVLPETYPFDPFTPDTSRINRAQ